MGQTSWRRGVCALGLVCCGVLASPAGTQPAESGVTFEAPAGVDFKIEAGRVESRAGGGKRLSLQLSGPSAITFSNGFRIRSRGAGLRLEGETSKGPFVFTVLQSGRREDEPKRP